METTPESLQSLIQEGWSLIESESWDEAIALTEELKAAGSDTGYRLRSVIFQMQEDPAAALTEVKAGVKLFPKSWEMQMQLGNLLSDTGDLTEAQEVYQKAQNLPGAELHWLQMNQAVALFRQQSFEDALTLLQKIVHPEAINEAFALQLTILDAIGRHDLILEIAEEDLELLKAPEGDEDAQILSNICTSIASAAWYEDKGEEMVMYYLRQAFEYQRGNTDALWLWREMNPVFSENARFYTLLLRGKFAEEDQSEGEEFMTSYGVIADTVEEAMEMIQAFEKGLVAPDSWELLEAEDEGESEEEDAKGIYYVSGFGVFEPDSEGEA